MVAHLVHADADGHTAVVAVLFKTGNANALINQLWNNIPTEKNKAVDVSGTAVDARDLLPSDFGYFTFSGSLTTAISRQLCPATRKILFVLEVIEIRCLSDYTGWYYPY
jgi:carbonic anhydrase